MFLSMSGLKGVRPAPVLPPSKAVLNDGPTGQVDGLTFFEVMCQASTYARPSEGLSDAEAAALAAGKPFGVSVLDRPEKGIEEAYVVMSLQSFARLAREHQEGTT